MTRILELLDRYVFRHRWPWLCNLTWDRQLEEPQAVEVFKKLLDDEK